MIYEDLPSNACKVRSEPWLFNLTLNTYQYYLPPNISVKEAEELSEISFKPLKVAKMHF